MDWWLLFAVFLYFVSASLIIAEVFIPSGGVLGIMAFFSVAGGVAIFFNNSNLAGWIGVVIAVIMIPAVLITAYKMLPRTKFGKSVILDPPERQKGDAIPDTDNLLQMLGKQGKVVTPLRPVGMCDFAGQRLECVAESGYVEKDNLVEVIHMQGTQLTVRIKDNTK